MVALSKVQAARRAGMEKRRNEALPRNDLCPWLGKRSVSFQAKFTAIAVNLKRIAALWRDMELVEAKAAVKPKRFLEAAPLDGSRRFTASIWWINRENLLLDTIPSWKQGSLSCGFSLLSRLVYFRINRPLCSRN